MGQLVFQATLGGQVNLVGPNTASTFNLNVPAVAGNLITSGDSATVTNTMLAGSIANAKLSNSSVTVGSTSIALGATATTLAGLTSLATNTLSSASATALTLQSAGTTAITVDTSQNVGIGTASPNAKLEVYVTRTSSTSATAIILSDNATGSQTNGVYKSIRSVSNNNASQSEIRFLESDGTNNNTSIAFATANSAGGITERMRVLNTGNVLCLAGGNTTATGTGIAFPSSQNASADANTLDDYEEGTWTPNFQNNGSTSNWTTKSGRYVKIGQQVTIWFTNGGGGSSNGGSGNGAIILNGLPFPLSYGNSFNGQQAISIIGGSNTNQPGLDWLTSQGGTGTSAQVAYNAAGNQEQNALTYLSGVWTYLTA